MTLTIRAARPGDLPGIYNVLQAAFEAPIELFIDQTERDSTFRWRHARVAELDGRIVAHVRIFARTMLVCGVPVRAGGVGSVATSPEHEGRGYATALLYDAMDDMHRIGMPVAYLYTGRTGFYERVGFRITEQPGFHADPGEVTAADNQRAYDLRRIDDADVPALLRIYRTATRGETGSIVRTPRIWRDAQTWLGEDHAGCLIAEYGGRPVAYIRSRQRDGERQILEAEHMGGHESAIAALLAAVGSRPQVNRIVASVPDDHALAAALRALPSTTSSTDVAHVPHPMMMRIISLERLLDVLLPRLRESARTNPGEPFGITMRAPDSQQATLNVSPKGASLKRRAARYALDEAATLDVLLGQKRASRLVRPRPPREVARRIDAMLPENALHFWNSDRI